VRFDRTFRFFSKTGWNLEFVPESDCCNFQYVIHFFNIASNMTNQVFGRSHSPHVQCGSKGAGQSTGHSGDHVVQGCRIFRARDLSAVLFLVETSDPAMNSEIERIGKTINEPFGAVQRVSRFGYDWYEQQT
jgi:hypothetical protein